MKKAILGLAMIGLIAPASLQAEENASCGWLHYAAGGLTVAGAAVTNGVFLLSTAVSTTTSGFMFCDWWGAMFALQQEQIIYVAGCAPSDRPGGNAIERLIEASVRRTLSDDLAEATRQNDLPVFLIRPDKQRLNPFEVTGRAQIGNERLNLSALVAHGRRDALRLFVEPVLGDEASEQDRNSMKVPQAGPREL